MKVIESIEKVKSFVCETDGGGLWSHAQKKVRIKSLVIDHVSEYRAGSTYLSIKAFFDKRTWNVERYGLIYTDEQWLKDFRMALRKSGVPEKIAKNIDYTEQGMQGDNFVSLSVCYLGE